MALDESIRAWFDAERIRQAKQSTPERFTLLGNPVDRDRMERENLKDPEVHARNAVIVQVIHQAMQDACALGAPDTRRATRASEEIIKFFYLLKE